MKSMSNIYRSMYEEVKPDETDSSCDCGPECPCNGKCGKDCNCSGCAGIVESKNEKEDEYDDDDDDKKENKKKLNKKKDIIDTTPKVEYAGKVQERTLTEPEMKKKEKIVTSMKKKADGFEERYGKRGKSVMYATATKLAKRENIEYVFTEQDFLEE